MDLVRDAHHEHRLEEALGAARRIVGQGHDGDVDEQGHGAERDTAALIAEGVLIGFHYAFSTWPFRKTLPARSAMGKTMRSRPTEISEEPAPM